MIIVQIIMWLAFGAVSLVCIAYLFNVFGKVEEHKKHADWLLQLLIVVSFLYSVYTFGKWLQGFCDGVSPTGHGEGACARGGAAPLSPPRILPSHQ